MLGWLIASFLLALGPAFAIAGGNFILAKGVFVVYANVPGGLHTHGLIMTALGAAFAVTLTLPRFGHPDLERPMRFLLWLIFCYMGWCVGLFCWAPAAGGDFSWVAVVTWGTVALMPQVLLIGPAPLSAGREETDLLDAAVAVGISPNQARALAGVLYGGTRERR